MKPYLSDEEIREAKGYFRSKVGPDWNPFGTDRMVSGFGHGAEYVRDLYEAHCKELMDLLAEARDAIGDVLGGSRYTLCEHLSHPRKEDRHKYDEPCPPIERLADLLARIEHHTNPT